MVVKACTGPEELLQRIRAMPEEIPGFEPVTLAKARSIVASVKVTPEFLGIIMPALSASATLRAAFNEDPKAMRARGRVTPFVLHLFRTILSSVSAAE